MLSVLGDFAGFKPQSNAISGVYGYAATKCTAVIASGKFRAHNGFIGVYKITKHTCLRNVNFAEGKERRDTGFNRLLARFMATSHQVIIRSILDPRLLPKDGKEQALSTAKGHFMLLYIQSSCHQHAYFLPAVKNTSISLDPAQCARGASGRGGEAK